MLSHNDLNTVYNKLKKKIKVEKEFKTAKFMCIITSGHL